jgi:diguanylate cyclase (GGDEF)-like protein
MENNRSVPSGGFEKKRTNKVAAQIVFACVTFFVVLLILLFNLEGTGSNLFFGFGWRWLILGLGAGALYLFVRSRLSLLEKETRADGEQVCYDSVTGLPNRAYFNGILSEALRRARNDDREFEVMYLDLDRFRNIVRTLGPGAGQEVLRQVAGRLTDSVGSDETLAHLGSDQFVVLAPENESPENAQGLASRLLTRLEKPFYYLEHPLYLTASIGIALFPHDGRDEETLLKNAYAAANRAKEMGGNLYQFYFPDLSEYASSTLLLENRLHEALESEEFSLSFQPQAVLSTGRIDGMEVLVSWKHPDHPGLTPSEFIPLAEESGLIEPMGEWILRSACEQNRKWQEAGLPPLRIAVNVSARQFYRGNLVELVKDILAEARLDPRWLELEITETVLMQDVEETINTLDGLNRLGVRIAVDDFGTGYSSLSYLKKFPIHTLKIDHSFVDHIPGDEEARAIVAAVIAMGHAMGLEVVAEGGERLEQWGYLAEKGCDKIQGFLVSTPLNADEFAAFMEKNAGLATARQLN